MCILFGLTFYLWDALLFSNVFWHSCVLVRGLSAVQRCCCTCTLVVLIVSCHVRADGATL